MNADERAALNAAIAAGASSESTPRCRCGHRVGAHRVQPIQDWPCAFPYCACKDYEPRSDES